MAIPIVWGRPLTVWLGLVVFTQIVFQVLTGSRRIILPFMYHRVNGYLILVLGLIHGIMAASMYL